MGRKTGQIPKYTLTWNGETKGFPQWASDPNTPDFVTAQNLRNRYLERKKSREHEKAHKTRGIPFKSSSVWHNATDEIILLTPPMKRKGMSKSDQKQVLYVPRRSMTPEEIDIKIQAMCEGWGV